MLHVKHNQSTGSHIWYPDLLESQNVEKKCCRRTCDAVVLIFLENSRSRDLRSKAWIDRQKEKIYQGLQYLSDALSAEKYFIDAHFTIADIAVFCCLEYLDLRFPEFDWRNEHSNLDNFWQTHQSRQSFLETTPIAQIIEPLSD